MSDDKLDLGVCGIHILQVTSVIWSAPFWLSPKSTTDLRNKISLFFWAAKASTQLTVYAWQSTWLTSTEKAVHRRWLLLGDWKPYRQRSQQRKFKWEVDCVRKGLALKGDRTTVKRITIQRIRAMSVNTHFMSSLQIWAELACYLSC